MAIDLVPFVPADGTITIRDGAASPLIYTHAYEEGDFSADEFSAGHFDTEVFMDRGVPFAGRNTNKRPINFQFSGIATDFTDTTERCLLDVAMKTGAFASATSTIPAGDVWMVEVRWTGVVNGVTKVLTLKKCRINVSWAEGTPAKFGIKGVAYAFADADIAFS